ncbi:MAG: hypothetical protein WBA77_19285 [Microcoleaceae cyanobacterium]
MANSEQEKQQKKEHLARSLGKFDVPGASASLGFMGSDERKKRIMDHIRLTRG